MRRLFEAVPAAVSVTLTTSAGHSTLTVRLDFSADVPERDNPVGTILADLEHVRIVMTERRFVSATGFDLVNGTVATNSTDWMNQGEKAHEAKGTIQLTLIWEAGPV